MRFLTTGRFAALALAFVLPAAAGSLALAGCDAAGPDPATADARAASGFTTVRMNVGGPAVHGRQAKVAVCHRDDDAGTFLLIRVGEPALPAHVRHGDGVPGGAVPGQEGSTFDAACALVAAAPFTCTSVAGVDALGRNTLTATVIVNDPAFLPLLGLGIAYTNSIVESLNPVVVGGVVVGGTGAVTQNIPGFPSTLSVRAVVSGGGGQIGLSCGPYVYGSPPV